MTTCLLSVGFCSFTVNLTATSVQLAFLIYSEKSKLRQISYIDYLWYIVALRLSFPPDIQYVKCIRRRRTLYETSLAIKCLSQVTFSC